MEAKHVELVFLCVVSDAAYLASTNMTFHKATMHLTTEFNCLQCDYTPRDKFVLPGHMEMRGHTMVL